MLSTNNGLLAANIKTSYRSTTLIVLTSIISLILELASPWPLKILIDNILGSELLPENTFLGQIINSNNSITFNVIIVTVTYFLIHILSYICSYSLNLLKFHTYQKMSQASTKYLVNQINHLHPSYLNQHDRGEILYKLSNNANTYADIIIGTLMNTISATILFISTLYILTRLDISMTLCALISLPFVVTVVYVLTPKIEASNTLVQNANNRLYGFLENLIGQIEQIRIYMRSKQYLNLFSTYWKNTQDNENRLNKTNAQFNLLNGVITLASYTLIIWFGFHEINNGLITTGILIIFLTYYDSLVTPLLDLADSFTNFREHRVRIANITDLIDDKNHVRDTGHIKTIPHTRIIVDHVTLVYNDRTLLNDVTTEFNENSLYFIIGQSGSGKTSLLNLLSRTAIADPKSGQITIGGEDIYHYTLDALYSTITQVPQHISLHNTSIRNIITFHENSQFSDQQIYHAAELACIDDVIRSSTNGLDTLVGEDGNNFSGGQKQRLLLARALLRNSKILLLDEIFSGQDGKTRQKLLTSIRKIAKNKTVIITTHNRELLSPNDNTLIFSQGRLVAQGIFKSIDNYKSVRAHKQT